VTSYFKKVNSTSSNTLKGLEVMAKENDLAKQPKKQLKKSGTYALHNAIKTATQRILVSKGSTNKR
jgi:hypothetical protein